MRGLAAVSVGLIQVVVGAVLAFLSLESLGLVNDADFSVNWVLATIAAAFLTTVGGTVAYISGRSTWLQTALIAAGAAAILGVGAGVISRSVLIGVLVFVTGQFIIALVPHRKASGQSTE